MTSPHTLIVGAGSGIGFALARDLVGSGHRLTLAGRSQDKLEAAVARLRSERADAQLQTLVVDLSDHASARGALGSAQAVDHLVLCGSSDVAWGAFATLDMGAVDRALHMKLTGYLNASQAVLPQLAAQGSVTFVGGAASRAAMLGTAGLAAVNGALEAVTRTLARELAPRRVNLVSPGLTDTEAYDAMPPAAKQAQFAGAASKLPAGRTGRPQDISPAIALAIGNPFMTGSVIDVDGGAHLG